MITKNDLIVLLTNIQDDGIDISDKVKKVAMSEIVDIDILKFINDKRQLDLTKFYEKLRISYNNKKSKLYINIMKDLEEPYECLITLSSLLNQILLFSKIAEDKAMFLKHSRAEEISKVLINYFKTANIVPCIKLLRLIKTDIKVLESIK